MNAMASSPAIPIVGIPAADAKILTAAPFGTPLPDISRQPGFVAAYPYNWEDGTLAMLIGRFEVSDEKVIGQTKKRLCPYTLWQNPDGSCNWVRKGMEGKRPLYNLPELVERPNAMVIISEGEKCADAVNVEFPECVSTTWSGGTNAIQKTDFSILHGRDVVIFPDHDDPGRMAARTLQQVLTDIGAKRVRTLDIDALAALISNDVQQGYDIADAIGDGLTNESFKALLVQHPALIAEPSVSLSPEAEPTVVKEGEKDPKEETEEEDAVVAHMLKEWGTLPDLPDGFSLSEAGIYKHGTTSRDIPTSTYAGSPLAVVRRCHNGSEGGGWGYIVTFRKPNGTWGTTIIPARLLAGDGKEMRETLADGGYICPQDRAGRQALAEYISYSKPAGFAEVASRPGWHGESFVLPHVVINPADVSHDVQLNMQGRAHLFGEMGTFDAWQKLAKMTEHSSRAAFALVAAFVGPLLRPLNEGGGGFHLFGRSSRGKTTLLRLAGSVWGGGGRDGFVNAWLATGNGIEGLAADHNDVLLALDELTMMPPEQTADLYYMLANGQGKTRATKTGDAKAASQWRAVILSSGEGTSAAHIRSGNRGMQQRLTGGVTVRMIDIPIEPTPGQTFEDLADFETEGAFAEHIGQTSCSEYGHAGPAFVQHLIGDKEKHIANARQIMEAFVNAVTGPDDDPQVKRVAKRFGLVAAAGTLATQFGVLPWHADSAIKATTACYSAWKEARGTNRSEEEREALRALREFFEVHGASRFEPIKPETSASEGQIVMKERDWQVRDRCGYRAIDEDGNAIYYVLPEAFRSHVCGVHTPAMVEAVARECGALILGEDDRAQKKVRLPEYPNGTRVYAIMLHKLS